MDVVSTVVAGGRVKGQLPTLNIGLLENCRKIISSCQSCWKISVQKMQDLEQKPSFWGNSWAN